VLVAEAIDFDKNPRLETVVGFLIARGHPAQNKNRNEQVNSIRQSEEDQRQ
jgi:hypothetical protein